MNLLFLIEALSAGGAERQLINIMNGLSEKGHKVFLFTWVNHHHFKTSDIPNVNWIHHTRKGKFDLSLFMSIRRLIIRNEIKIVQGFLDTGNLYAYICTIFMKDVKVFASERSSKRKLKGLSKYHKFWVHRLVEKTISNSEAGKKFINEISGAKVPVEIVRNGFDLVHFNTISELEKERLRKQYGIENNSIVFINVARIIPIKRQLEIVIAFKDLFKNKNALLLLVGNSNDQYLSQIEVLLSENGLREKVRIFTANSKIQEYYQFSDVFILNSDFEGSPNTLVEAMLCGLPIITTKCGDAPFYVEDTKGNEIITVGDNQELRDGMLRLFEMKKSERKEIGIQNRQHLTQNKDVTILGLSNNYERIYLGWN
jgi:glycosyltransferase involved in cell wall biosynthesis